MNLLLAFPFNENNNKSKSAQAIINCLSGCYVCFFVFSWNQTYREISFLVQQENIKNQQTTEKHFQIQKRLIILLNCIKKMHFFELTKGTPPGDIVLAIIFLQQQKQ